MSSADNLCKQIGPRSGPPKRPDQARQNVGPDRGQSVWHSDGIPERIIRKSWFWKKSAADDKKEWLFSEGGGAKS